MRHHEVLHSRDGFVLRVSEGPAWSYAFAEGVERSLAAIGHPCCWRGAGRLPGIGIGCYRLLNWSGGVDYRRRTDLLELPITANHAIALGWPSDVDGLDDDVASADSEAAPRRRGDAVAQG